MEMVGRETMRPPQEVARLSGPLVRWSPPRLLAEGWAMPRGLYLEGGGRETCSCSNEKGM